MNFNLTKLKDLLGNNLTTASFLITIFTIASLVPIFSLAAQPIAEPGNYEDEEYSEGLHFKRREPESEYSSVTSKSPWRSFSDDDQREEINHQESHEPLWGQILLWLPNRILDFIDVFKFDVGVGPAVGGVVRVTKSAQVGLRDLNPGMVRVGNFGRRTPVLVETQSEYGISPGFKSSKQRRICEGEVGVGLDILLVGGYFGICFNELGDFLGGFVTLDTKNDDLHVAP